MNRHFFLATSLVALTGCSSSSTPDAPTADAGTEIDSAIASDAGSSSLPPSADASMPPVDGDTDGGTCSAARAQLLGSVDSVSTGDVTPLGTSNGVVTLYIDASAGGIAGADANPWIFVDLAAGTKIDVTGTTSTSSTAWDLAFKRPVIYTNDGDGGPGRGGAVLVSKDFDSVTSADATGAAFGTEKFFDAQCNPSTDPTGAALTTFSTWYNYDESTHILTPATGTWLVHGGTGKLYKLQIQTYYATADGGVGTGDGGTYLLRIGAL